MASSSTSWVVQMILNIRVSDSQSTGSEGPPQIVFCRVRFSVNMPLFSSCHCDEHNCQVLIRVLVCLPVYVFGSAVLLDCRYRQVM